MKQWGWSLGLLAILCAGCDTGASNGASSPETGLEPLTLEGDSTGTAAVEIIPEERVAVNPEQWEIPERLVPKDHWTEECTALPLEDAVNCLESAFWPTFQDGLEGREALFERFTAVMEEHGEGASARLHFLRALLGVAIQTENSGEDSLVTPYIMTMKPDLDKACELEPENAFYNTWRLSGDLILGMMLQKDDFLAEATKASFDHANADFRNVMGIMSTWMAFSLESELPQQAFPMMEQWIADGHLDEIDNAWYRPFTRSGFLLMLGDMYARMGDAAKARTYLEESLAEPGAESWPYRFLSEDLLDDLDETVAAYKALPDASDATALMVSWGVHSCLMCHGKALD